MNIDVSKKFLPPNWIKMLQRTFDNNNKIVIITEHILLLIIPGEIQWKIILQ